MVPVASSQLLIAMAAATAPVPNRWWPQAWPAIWLAIGVAVGDGGLRHARQRVHLGQDGDDRTVARPGARHEGGRHAGHAGLDGEAGAAQLVLQQRGGLGLLVAELRRRPDLERDLRNAGRIGVDGPDQLRLVDGGKLRRRSRKPAHSATAAVATNHDDRFIGDTSLSRFDRDGRDRPRIGANDSGIPQARQSARRGAAIIRTFPPRLRGGSGWGLC